MLDATGDRVDRPVQVDARERQGDLRNAELLTEPPGRRFIQVLAWARVAAAAVGPVQREPRLGVRPALQQHASVVAEQDDGEGPVQPTWRGVSFGDRGASEGHTGLVDQFDQVLFAIHFRLPIIRAAASLPEMSTIGTPTPGVVPEPVNTTLVSAG